MAEALPSIVAHHRADHRRRPIGSPKLSALAAPQRARPVGGGEMLGDGGSDLQELPPRRGGHVAGHVDQPALGAGAPPGDRRADVLVLSEPSSVPTNCAQFAHSYSYLWWLPVMNLCC